MSGKMARSAARPPFRAVHVAAAVRATRLPCQNAGKAQNSHWFGGSYGESRSKRIPLGRYDRDGFRPPSGAEMARAWSLLLYLSSDQSPDLHRRSALKKLD
jgi:hypothetical protein